MQEELSNVDATRPDGLPLNKNESDEPPTPNPMSATYKKRLSLNGKEASKNMSDSDD